MGIGELWGVAGADYPWRPGCACFHYNQGLELSCCV